MNILTHCKASQEIIKNRKLTSDEKALLFIGSVIPDVSEFGLVSYDQSHHGFNFLKSLDKKYYYLGLGVIFHGEELGGMDSYVHGPKGYIQKKEKEILKITKFYKKVFPKKTDFKLVTHLVIEFCFEYLTAEKNPEFLPEVAKSFKKKILMGALYSFANFFNINRKHVQIILGIGKTRRLEKFIFNFKTLKGTAHNFQNFMFLKNVRDKNQKTNWFERLTESSYGYLKSRFMEKRFEQMFARCVEVVRKDYDPLLNRAIKNLKKTIHEKNL